MNLIELALNEFKQKQSYYQLENDVRQQYNIFQEHKNLAAKEKRAREQVEALLEQIQQDKEQHQQFLKENNQNLAQLKENLFYEKQRITQCLDLLETELSAADGEMVRLRKEETQKQLDRLNNLQEQIDAQNQADELLSKSLAQQAEEMQALATHWSQTLEYLIKLLETEKMQLEK